MNIIDSLKRFAKGFTYATRGIINAVRSEKNLRFHLCAAFYVLIFMQFYDLTKSQTALVYVVIGTVIALELVNTAIEAVTDIASPEYNDLAKIAKDTAAGAVLAVSVSAAAVGVYFFWDTKVFAEIFVFLRSSIPAFAGLVASLILWFWIIFGIEHTKE